MNPNLAKKIFEFCLGAGADFAEIYEEETRKSHLSLKDNAIDGASASIIYGIGIRIIYGTEVFYGYTSDASESSLMEIAKNLSYNAAAKAARCSSAAVGAVQSYISYPKDNFKDPRILGQSFKKDFLFKANSAARINPKILQAETFVADSVQNINIWNSEGLQISDDRARIRFSVNATAGENSELTSAHEAPGALGGYEFLENLPIEELAASCAERALRMLSAPYIKGGQMPVVMGNAFGGVIFHEACGHPLETEAVRRKASPFCGKLGEKIANPVLTAIDDGTLSGAWGSLSVDDEGAPTQKTVLIEKGILKNFLSDRVGAKELGVPLTGSARRESYRFAPVSRMRNTFIAPGNSSLEDMLAAARNGLYAAKMAGGSVNPATGEFNFAVEEGYEIKDGKLGSAVRGATLIGLGHEILPKISMVGSDLELAAGMCGAGSGHIPVTVGQPSIKVDSILVGGR
jgi:TldD protein|uniref:TldD protein, part of proposed TldE/TldD proteolytic complex n=1 Tax=uncultured bacterium contig00117 TaxID=1181578 RepID=A0A806KK06_9BACT|nr:TldD protein, part of proposed TldE/TldD proteolytic complex [uncultured bacterium contig00117]